MFCAGLTGGIGSGKSTVAQMLVEAGAGLIDADAISRQATAPSGAAIAAIEAQWGSAMLTPDRALDRAAMRALMLRDGLAKQQLECIIHPIVGQEIARQREQHRQGGMALCVIDIPLLAEGAARWRPALDAVWVVDCSEATQHARVAQRSQWPAAQIAAVIAMQASRAQRRAMADAVLLNENTDFQQLRAQVQQLCRQFGL